MIDESRRSLAFLSIQSQQQSERGWKNDENCIIGEVGIIGEFAKTFIRHLRNNLRSWCIQSHWPRQNYSHCPPELSPALTKQYNKYLDESCFPSCWKSSSVVPVFKKEEERSDPGKYRPINLLPVISKIFDSFINNSLTKHLDITGLFSDLQYGFRAFRSTADILDVLSIRWMQVERQGYCGLLHKLNTYGVVGPILGILESFLQERSLKVVLDGQSSPLYITNSSWSYI